METCVDVVLVVDRNDHAEVRRCVSGIETHLHRAHVIPSLRSCVESLLVNAAAHSVQLVVACGAPSLDHSPALTEFDVRAQVGVETDMGAHLVATPAALALDSPGVVVARVRVQTQVLLFKGLDAATHSHGAVVRGPSVATDDAEAIIDIDAVIKSNRKSEVTARGCLVHAESGRTVVHARGRNCVPAVADGEATANTVLPADTSETPVGNVLPTSLHDLSAVLCSLETNFS